MPGKASIGKLVTLVVAKLCSVTLVNFLEEYT